MKKWSLSKNGATLFIFWIFLPILLRNAKGLYLAHTFSNRLVLAVIFLLLTTLVYFLSIEQILHQGVWRDLVAWYQSSFAMAGLYLFYGVFIYLTGMSPSKYHSISIDKDAALYPIFYAVVFAVIGIGTYWKNQSKRNT